MSELDLRLGRWEDVLTDVAQVDAVIADPPYSARTHVGHDHGVRMTRGLRGERRAISYSRWSRRDVDSFVDSWAPRCRGWFCVLSDHSLCPVYQAAFRRHGLTDFAPVGILIPGMTVRLAGDGPSSWVLYANVARPKALCRWGTLPGGYSGSPDRDGHIGGKPEWLMRALVRDYTRAGDLVCDPCAGFGTTALAALGLGRLFVGAEVDPKTHASALRRLRGGIQAELFA